MKFVFTNRVNLHMHFRLWKLAVTVVCHGLTPNLPGHFFLIVIVFSKNLFSVNEAFLCKANPLQWLFSQPGS